MTTLLKSFDINFTAILCTEMWCTSASEVYCPDGYQYFFRNRQDKRGGGVLFLVQDCIACEIVKEYSLVTTHYELVTVRSNNSLFSIIYRPPSGDLNQFISSIDNLFDYVMEQNIYLYLGGDMNIDMLADTNAQRDFQSTINAHGFSNVIKNPTRVTVDSSSLLDLFITNITNDLLTVHVVYTDISDHLGIIMLIDNNNRVNK